MKWILVTALLVLGTASACSTIRRKKLDAFESSLAASMEPVIPQAVVGKPLDVRFTLHNHGTSTLSGCFGEAFEVTFNNGTQTKGLITVVDHPSCKRHFDLAPGDTAQCVYTTTVPTIPAGPAKLYGFVQVVSLYRCTQYGCDALAIKVVDHPQVEIVANGEE
jgi:hypothetical protein